jgi:hypothetical protein
MSIRYKFLYQKTQKNKQLFISLAINNFFIKKYFLKVGNKYFLQKR